MTHLVKKRVLERFIINCLQCNKQFTVAFYRKDTTKFCSRKCLALSMRIKFQSDCLICSKSFFHISSRCNKAKYCSRKCYHKAQTVKGSIKQKCIYCDKEYLTSPSRVGKRKFCSVKCINKKNKSNWKPNFSYVRNSMKSRGMIELCARCGFKEYPQILGVHHKDRNRKNNELQNLEVLCPNCHSIEHMKHVTHSSK